MQSSKSLNHFFQQQLLDWHQNINERALPWKHESDPYKIWLSEIILQQTRAEQGIPYYLKYITKYPTVQDLAAASQEELYGMWQGLGYYNRCKNMHRAAKIICENYQGIFPKNYEQILALPGVGTYTAAAIASFAFKQAYAVVDGNVYRLLSRFWGIDTPIDSTQGKKQFAQLAQELISTSQPDLYNQAIMDFGALICTPKLPKCTICPFATTCVAYKRALIDLLPIKEKKIKITERAFHFFLLQYHDEIYIEQRIEQDIWQHLFQLFLIETDNDFSKNKKYQLIENNIKTISLPIFNFKQKLTHQTIQSHFYLVQLKSKPHHLEGRWVLPSALTNFGFPKTIISFFKQNNYF